MPEKSDLPEAPAPDEAATDEPPPLECPHCGSHKLKLLSETPKPTWKQLFYRESDTCPGWYADLQRGEHRLLWTAAYGEDGEEFYDWYLETQVEGAKETESPPSPPLQLFLPGMTPTLSFTIESF